METSDITVTITVKDLAELVAKLNEAARSAEAYRKMLEEEREEYKHQKRIEAEREANIREKAEREYMRRVKVLELNERRVGAHAECHNTFGMSLDHMLSILSKRITNADRVAIEKERKIIEDAWQKFDAVQKQIADELRKETWDPCKQKMPPNTKDSICAECAAKLGKVPVDYPVGQWTGKCDFCGQEKPLSSLSHDYVDKEGSKQ